MGRSPGTAPDARLLPLGPFGVVNTVLPLFTPLTRT